MSGVDVVVAPLCSHTYRVNFKYCFLHLPGLFTDCLVIFTCVAHKLCINHFMRKFGHSKKCRRNDAWIYHFSRSAGRPINITSISRHTNCAQSLVDECDNDNAYHWHMGMPYAHRCNCIFKKKEEKKAEIKTKKKMKWNQTPRTKKKGKK